ncbi:hypothetical protein L1887_06743 [Cichorium endivia]|nr:hypothetical protein L1887_06743 [Cichorium endivia]
MRSVLSNRPLRLLIRLNFTILQAKLEQFSVTVPYSLCIRCRLIEEAPMNSSISAMNDQKFTAPIEENPLKSVNSAIIEHKSSVIYCEFEELPWILAKIDRNSTEKEEQFSNRYQQTKDNKDIIFFLDVDANFQTATNGVKATKQFAFDVV